MSGAAWRRRPDVVFIVLESFRADIVGAEHDGHPITPVLNALARRGISASRAYSHNARTAPSRFHMLSGSLVGGDGRSLVDDFKDHGYLTGYFSGQDESFSDPEYAVGFERADVWYDARQDRNRRYTTFATPGSLAVPFSVLQERIAEFLENRGRASEPLFLYVNFHDTHFPYVHDVVQTLVSTARLPRSAIRPSARASLWATYVNTAANVDRAVGELIAAVRRVRGSEPAVIVTADHGESLFEEGFLGHGYALNEIQTRVPLIVANLPMLVEEPFGHLDLRRAIHSGLHVPAEASSLPELRADNNREIFQYVGNLERPRQIAFLRSDRRLIYDFRRRRVQFGTTSWERPETVPAPERAELTRLVHAWERMVLASRSRLGHDR